MKYLKEDFIKIYQNERGLLIFMILNLLLSLALIIFSCVQLNPNSAVIKIGYGDIGGYRDGAWFELLSFTLLGVIFGFLHNLLAIKIFHKRGSGMAKLFLIVTTVLILGSFLVLNRLLGEG